MTRRFDLTTFGEGGLRLGVPAGRQIQTATGFDVHMAGAEANVACTLARLGWSSSWMSCVADDPMGERVLHSLRGAGVDLTGVVRKRGVRTGIYFIEHAHAPRPTRVFYDRKDTGAALLTAAEIDWAHLLNARVMHHTGITAGLSPTALEIVTTALRKGRAAGVVTSFDVNHRNLLWTAPEARRSLQALFGLIEILFCSRRDARAVFGVESDPAATAHALAEITGASYVVISNGGEEVTGLSPIGLFTAPARKAVMLDRAGAGDALVSGVLHGILKGDFAEGLRYGQVLAAMAMSQQGDRVVATAAEIDYLVHNEPPDIER